MKEYFKLHYKMLNRKMEEAGFHPVLGYVIAIIGFYGISGYLFSKAEFAEYFYGLISISFISKLSENRRNSFLKNVFSINQYKKLRIIENLLIACPFLIFLLYFQSIWVILILIFASVIMSFFDFKTNFNYTIPTPFSLKPFEFPIGFRKTFYFFPFAYFLTYQSILSENFNLGVFSMLIIVVVILSYYSKPEKDFFVWSFNLSSKNFLMNKIMIGLLYSTLLSLPVIISLIIFFPNNTLILMGFLLLSYFYIIAIILAKYSAYPNEMSLPEGILIAFSIMFPPILLGVIPLFYSKSVNKLNLILEDD